MLPNLNQPGGLEITEASFEEKLPMKKNWIFALILTVAICGCGKKAIQNSEVATLAYINKGLALSALGKKEQAVNCYDQAIKINPNYSDAYYNKGNALFDLGKK